MYRDSYQRGMLTVFYSCGSKPLNIWETRTQDGYISRFLDQDIKSMVMDICGTNISTTYITCPKGKQVLGIHMPFLVMIVKNLKKYFSFEVTILDETNTRRRFRVSNFQSTTQILPLCTVMPIGLSEGWNQIQFNLAEFTRRAYQKQFVEVQKLKINANIRLRRIYFADKLMADDELPPEYRLYFPIGVKNGKKKKAEGDMPDTVKPSTSQQMSVPATQVEKPPSVTAVLQPSSKMSINSVKKLSISQESRRSGTQIGRSSGEITEVTEVTETALEITTAVEGDIIPKTEEEEGGVLETNDVQHDGAADETANEPGEVDTETLGTVEGHAEEALVEDNAGPGEPLPEKIVETVE